MLTRTDDEYKLWKLAGSGGGEDEGERAVGCLGLLFSLRLFAVEE